MALQLMKSLVLMIIVLPLAAFAQDHGHGGNNAPYAGFEAREIKSLSEQDIEELRRGGGWGLALPAELNGRPGPAHLLELEEELDLSASQVEAISAIYEQMRTAAVAAGERFIAAEAALSDAFAGSDFSEEKLRNLLAEAAEARAELRFIHLSRHLSTPELLSDAQIQRYNVLRGYADDPCETVPDGHDPEMWRRHNGCE
ncbi:MAG: Spy/CpxP family protein refolding chaperone [Alphaproteobacteria bacterium]|nr:Spy/CpxP family protein refolding chaperone [Alphaproteobacteria bacterium]